MTELNFKKSKILAALYLCLLAIAFFISIYSLYIDLLESINRGLGLDTFFSQRSWLNDKQAMLYCSIWIMLFATFTTFLGYSVYRKNRSKSILISILILVLFLVSVVVEPLFYNKLP